MARTEDMTEEAEAAARVVMSEGGRIVIPANVRRALGVGPGDALSLRVENNELRILPQREAVRRAQALVAERVASGRSLVTELLDERAEEAGRE